jgi:hypothetical protein
MNAAARQWRPGDIPWDEAISKVEKVRRALQGVSSGQDAEKKIEPLIDTCIWPVEDICNQIPAADERRAFRALITGAVAANMTLIAHQRHRALGGAGRSGRAAAAADQAWGDLWKDAYDKTSELRDALRDRSRQNQ